MSSPQTRICICQNLGLSNAYQHTYWFDSVSEQTAFFESKVTKTFVNYAYVRKNWSLKLGATVAEAEKWSYLFFRNSPTGRYYYYFITDVKYISDDTVELALEMDVLQTYFFDYALQPSFIEREHSATDEVGDNTIEEGLELGHYITNGIHKPEFFNEISILAMSTVALSTGSAEHGFSNTSGGIYDGLYSGCEITHVKLENAVQVLASKFDALDNSVGADAIVTLWEFPTAFIRSLGDIEYTNNMTRVAYGKCEPIDFEGIVRPTTLDFYEPKNKKLLTYPYSYLYATNNAGNSAIYRYERFNGGISFVFDGSIFPDGGIKATPKNYNGVGFNYDESLNLTGFPTCSWSTDTYKIWLAQNQSQRSLGYAVGGVSSIAGLALAVGGAVTANPVLIGSGVATLAGGATSIFKQLAQEQDMEKQPPQAKGSNSTTLNTAIGQQCIQFYKKSISAERARVIDDFFTMYGYRTLRVKTPNRNVRQSFTYTKTQGCLLTGSLCQEDARKIMSIYDNGVTFWQKSVAIGNYSATNTPK